MKNLLVLLAFFLPFVAFAQKNEGEIIFEEKIKFEIDLPEEHENMRAMIPSSQTSESVLLFNKKMSIYKDKEESAEDTEITQEAEAADGNVQFKMVIARPDNRTFKDLEKGKKVEKQDFMGRIFLIKDDLNEYPWKLTGEQKTILDYACQKATFEEEDRKVEAWFAPQIPISNGPANYGNLPGMILELTINDGERTMTAKEINFKKLDKGMIEEPKKGKEVTEAEFEKIRDEKMKEMEAEMGGGGMIKMRIGN